MTDSGFQLALGQARGYQAHSGVFMGPSARLLVDSMRLRSGDVVLDLACGTGLVAGHARGAVGPSGRVVGVDINPAMLAVAVDMTAAVDMAAAVDMDAAGADAGQPGPGIDWCRTSADALPYDDETFTHVACQQGLQFFPDAAAAVREARRVLRRGGSFLASIWATPGRNPYIETQLTLLAELDHTIAETARLATPAHADRLLIGLASDAGFADVGVSLLEHSVEIAGPGSFFIEQTRSTPWGPIVAALAPPERDELARTFVARLPAERTEAGHVTLPFCSYLLTAIR